MSLLGFTLLLFVSLHQVSLQKRTSMLSIQNTFHEGTSSPISVLLRELCRRVYVTYVPDMTAVQCFRYGRLLRRTEPVARKIFACL